MVCIVCPPNGIGDMFMAYDAVKHLSKMYNIVILHSNPEDAMTVYGFAHGCIDLGIKNWTKKGLLVWGLTRYLGVVREMRKYKPYLTVQFDASPIRQWVLYKAGAPYHFQGGIGYGCQYDLNNQLVGA